MIQFLRKPSILSDKDLAAKVCCSFRLGHFVSALATAYGIVPDGLQEDAKKEAARKKREREAKKKEAAK